MNKELAVTLLSSDVSECSGWGRFTHEFCLALYRRHIPFELHLPKTAKSNAFLPFHECLRFDLPPPFLSFGKRWWYCLGLWWGSQAVIVKGKLIHSLVEFPYGVTAYWLARRYHLPFGLTVHGTYAVKPLRHFVDRWFYRATLKNATFITAVSNFTKERLIRRTGLKLPLRVIHNGVNFSYFSRSHVDDGNLHQTPGMDEPEKTVLCVGALKRRKGVDILLEAFARVSREQPAARLIMIGSGDKTPYLHMAETLKISDRVAFTDRVDDRQLLRFYKTCDVFALLPREDEHGHFEGFGLVYLEAGACGKPVVGTWSGGVPDAVLDGVTGLLVPPEHPEEAANVILTLLRGEELRHTMGEAGRRWAQEHDWSQIIEQYLQVYETALQAKQV